MRSLYGAVLLAACLALAHAYPGRANRESSESDEKDVAGEGVVLVLPSPRRDIFSDFATDVDDSDEPSAPGLWNPLRFNSSPFSDLYTRMQEMMNRIRTQMATALASQLGQGGLTPWGKIPEGANTTSTTKIIGDHAVTINETTYSDGDENGGTVFRVRVVDIKPLNDTASSVNDSDEEEATDGEETPLRAGGEPTADKNLKSEDDAASVEENEKREELTTTTHASRSVETLEEFDNEIPKNQVETLSA